MYFYIKINGLVVLGPKSYFFRGLWPKNLKKVKKKLNFITETKYQCFGPKTNYCHYYLDTPVSQSLKTNDLPSV